LGAVLVMLSGFVARVDAANPVLPEPKCGPSMTDRQRVISETHRSAWQSCKDVAPLDAFNSCVLDFMGVLKQPACAAAANGIPPARSRHRP
jgi:hypothetical protein